MQDAPQLRDQLRSLSIPREQRPGAHAALRRGSRAGSLVLLLIVLALGGYIAWDKLAPRLPAWRTDPPAATQPVRTAEAAPQTESEAAAPLLTATGKIVSDHKVEVSTKVSGQVMALYFEQGDRVERGQVLAKIEDVLPRARRDEARGNVERAKAQAAFQQFNLARVTALYQQKQASDNEFADAQRAAHEADAQVTAAQAMLDYAEKVLRDCQVEAPISGVVLERNVEIGDFVAAEGGLGAMANSMFGAIADMDQLRVEVDVSELDVGRLRADLPCVVIPDAYKSRRYRGHVLWIDPGANYAKATVQVKVRIENPDAYLRVDGAAQVQFLVAPSATTSSAPAAAVQPP